MKTVWKSCKMMAIALTTLMSVGLSHPSFAGTGSTAELVYVGNLEDLPVFQLSLNNTEASDFVITIRDASQRVLLTEKLSGEKIVRKYKLDAEDFDLIAGTTFEVTNKKTNETTVYRISRTTKFVQDVVVAKL